MSLHDKLYRFINEYAEIYDTVNKTQNYKHPFGAFIRNEIGDEFKSIEGLDSSKYLVKARCGAGRWTVVPWIAVFDKRITESAQKGVYIVYLLNKDTKELYLTLNQGATEASVNSDRDKFTFVGVASSSSSKTLSKLRKNASDIRNVVKNIPFNIDDGMKCGSANYDAGAICYKKYSLKTLPSTKEIVDDLMQLLSCYNDYAEHYLSVNSQHKVNWWPSQEEYALDLTKDEWKKYILEVELPNHPSPMKMLKGMLELGGEASCKDLSDNYGGHPSAYSGCAMNLGRRVKKFFDLPACMDGEQERYFPFPFLGKYRGGNDDNYIYRIRPELVAALEEIDLTDIDPFYSEEHQSGAFDSWEIIDEVTAVKHCDKSFFEHNSSGVPKGICWFFGAELLDSGESKSVELIHNGQGYQAKISNDTTDRHRIRIVWESKLGKLFASYRSDDTTATFRKTDEDTYEVIIKGGEKEMTTKEKIATIKNYIAAKGFNYEGNLIENFYLSLKSKPFVILAGTSGTGKTRLVKLFAEAIGAEMKLVPVRPDWSDSSDLFGHTDLNNNFHPGAILEFIKKAEWNKDKPFFLCLDEMNLARVEYYLSDFLSIIETRDRKDNGDIETDALIDVDYYKNKEAQGKYGRVFIPENLYIVGTVNMDETTFPFSKKVLDRANTIEFSFVNLMAKPTEIFADKPHPLNESNSFLRTEYLYLGDCNDVKLIDSICFDLEELNSILVKANLHVGYRVRDEISFYMMNNKNADLLDTNAAFDNEIMQKILPRIQGSSRAIKDVLSEMFIKCAGDYTGLAGATDFEQMQTYIDSAKDCKYPNSSKKIAFMMRRYEEDGFTSYWL